MGGARRLLIVLVYVVIFWGALPAGAYGLGRLVDRLELFGPVPGWAGWLGWALAAAGAWLCLHAALLLRIKGKGLPISSLPPTQFVRSGPYRHFRHPIYTGYTLLVAGLGLVLGSPGTTLVVVPVCAVIWFLTWVKLYEEPGLLRRFGDSFRVHRDRTPIFFPLYLRRAARRLVLVFFRLFVRVRVEGREHVPREGPLLMVSNHLSYFDFMFAHYAHPRPMIVPVTAEVFRKPLQRAFLRLMGGVPKRRYCSDPAAARAIRDELAAGGIVGIAVEGERSWTGEMGRLPPGVARNISRMGCPIAPGAMVGSYRLWPRWAGGANKKVAVTIRIGMPFRLAEEIDGFVPGDPAQAAEVERVIVEHISALCDPAELSVDLTTFPSVRPELTLWRCPVCGAEERLAMEGPQLICAACGARWDTASGDLTLTSPPERAGERDTVAGWAAKAGGVPDLADPVGRPDPLITAAAELREDPAGATGAIRALQVVGQGSAELCRDRIAWRASAGEPARTIPLAAIQTVTTERNDTLQLGVGQGVVQLVFPRSSPLRWQLYLNRLKEAADV